MKLTEVNTARIFTEISKLLNDSPNGGKDTYLAFCEVLVKNSPIDNLFIFLKSNDDQPQNQHYYYFENPPPDAAMEEDFALFVAQFILKHSLAPQLIEQDNLAKIKGQKIRSKEELPQYFLGVPLVKNRSDLGLICTYGNSKNDITLAKELLTDIAPLLCLYISQNFQKTSLSSQTARLNAIFESSSDIIWSVNQDLELVSFNQNYFDAIFHKHDGETVAEYTKDGQVIEMPYFDFWNSKYKKCFEGNALNFEIQLKSKNGDVVWKEIFLNPIYLASGKIEEVSGIAHDISDKKQSQLALSENEEMFRNIFESFQDLYIRCDLQGRVTMVSPSCKEMMGYTEDQVLGKNVTNYYLYNTKTKNLIKKLLNGASIRNFEISLTSKNGLIIPCICNIRLVYDKKGRAVGLESVCRDITKLVKTNEELVKAKELAEASLKVKEQFLANMSHEIRTPMNGIVGMMDMLAETNLDNVQKTYLDTIKQSSDLMLNLLNDIIDLSKFNSGKIKLKKRSIVIRDFLNKVCTVFSAEAAKKNISISFEINDKVPQQIIADQTRLLQIFSNLLSNAIKFTNERGEITIKLAVVNVKKDKLKLKAEVIDNGIGIKNKHIKRLFTSFTQVDDSFSKMYKGAGLGLAITKNLVELLKGEIGVNSIYNEGSVFWFTFEVKKDNSPKQENKATSTPQISKTISQRPTVLLVDDNEINRTVGDRILTKAGVDVVVAEDGYAAIEQISNRSFDLIFMDIQLPEINGIDTMKKIRSIKKEACPPIIAMTAFSDDSEITGFIKNGFNDYQPKPIKAQNLIDQVVKWTTMKSEFGALNKSEGLIDLQPQILNMNTLNQLEKLSDRDTIVTSLQEFISETYMQLSDCKSELSNEGYHTIGENIHTIKGNSGTLGAEQMYYLSSEMEKNIREGQFSSLHEDLKSLYLIFVEFKNEVSNQYNLVFDG